MTSRTRDERVPFGGGTGYASRMRLALQLALALVVAATSCIVQAPTQEGTKTAAPKASAAPPVEVKNGANFGDKVELVQATLTPGRAAPGETVHVTFLFRVLDAIDREYMIFVHVEDADGRIDRLNVDHAPRGKPISQWQKGELIRDDFDVPVPPGMTVRALNLIMGLWDPRTDERMPLKNRDQVRNDGRDRVFVATIPMGS